MQVLILWHVRKYLLSRVISETIKLWMLLTNIILCRTQAMFQVPPLLPFKRKKKADFQMKLERICKHADMVCTAT